MLLTGSNIPEDGAGAMSGLSPRIRSFVPRSCDLPALESVSNAGSAMLVRAVSQGTLES